MMERGLLQVNCNYRHYSIKSRKPEAYPYHLMQKEIRYDHMIETKITFTQYTILLSCGGKDLGHLLTSYIRIIMNSMKKVRKRLENYFLLSLYVIYILCSHFQFCLYFFSECLSKIQISHGHHGMESVLDPSLLRGNMHNLVESIVVGHSKKIML